MVDPGRKGHQLADLDRLLELYLIDRERYGILLGKARGEENGHPIQQIERRAAVHLTAETRLAGRHQRRHFKSVGILLACHRRRPLNSASLPPWSIRHTPQRKPHFDW